MENSFVSSPDAPDLENIPAGRNLRKIELSVRPGDRGSAGCEERNLDLGQWLAALGNGDDAANVRRGNRCGYRERAEKDQGGDAKEVKSKRCLAQILSSDD